MKIEGRTFIISGGSVREFNNMEKIYAYQISRASGLGRACVEGICKAGGYVALLDMNEELAKEVVKEIGGGKTKFFEANVLETESISAAVKGSLAWSKETGKEIGGVVAAAGVATPAKVWDLFFLKYLFIFKVACVTSHPLV